MQSDSVQQLRKLLPRHEGDQWRSRPALSAAFTVYYYYYYYYYYYHHHYHRYKEMEHFYTNIISIRRFHCIWL